MVFFSFGVFGMIFCHKNKNKYPYDLIFLEKNAKKHPFALKKWSNYVFFLNFALNYITNLFRKDVL